MFSLTIFFVYFEIFPHFKFSYLFKTHIFFRYIVGVFVYMKSFSFYHTILFPAGILDFLTKILFYLCITLILMSRNHYVVKKVAVFFIIIIFIFGGIFKQIIFFCGCLKHFFFSPHRDQKMTLLPNQQELFFFYLCTKPKSHLR